MKTSLRVPGSKSYTNRALLIAAFAKGKSMIKNILLSDDTRSMLKALRQLGVRYKIKGNSVTIYGTGGILKKPASPIFVGNAGTTMRFLAATLATQPFETILTGNKRMRERPMGDLLSALRQLGASTESIHENDCPPLRIKGPLRGGFSKLFPGVSSQFLSGLLMASPYAHSPVSIECTEKLVSKPYVEMTLEVMKAFGIKIKRKGRKFFINPGFYHGKTYEVEGDASSASYFWGIGALTRKKVTIENILADSKQTDIQFLKILKIMGCNVTTSLPPQGGAPRVAGWSDSNKHMRKRKKGISVYGPTMLKPLGEKNFTDLPDASLTTATLCAFAKGVSMLRGLHNLRVKECDRLHIMATELRKLGIKIRELPDGWKIHGNPLLLKKSFRKKIMIETHWDHRIAMCFGMLKAIFQNLKIKNPNCVSKSYPNFWKDLRNAINRNIILTGMRGCGKTTLGKLLAKKLKRKFFDIDDMIVAQEKMEIPDMVAKYGWSYFRRVEANMVKTLAKIENAVIAAGGGTFLDPQNTKLFKKNGWVIFLKVPIQELQRRLKKEIAYRPSLIGKNPLAELPAIWKKRKEVYERVADRVVLVNSRHTVQNSLATLI